MSFQYRSEFDFHGGIHPPQHKQISNRTPLQPLPLPPRVIINLGQHAGQLAEPVVQVGQTVQRGEVIASAQGQLSANIHASISGVVSAIATQPIAHASGMGKPCIVIESDGQDRAIQLPAISEPLQQDRQTLLNRVLAAGIIGMGGAGFPSHVKLMPEVHHLIINAAECEPYITCDDALMQHYASDIISALLVGQYLTQASQLTIGIEDNKPEAIAALEQALQQRFGERENCPIRICVVPTKYPSGGEKQLIELITGKQVPSRQLPLSLGIIVHNVATLLAIYRAITMGEPVTERLMTITGNRALQPGNYWTRIGTPIDWILSQHCREQDPNQAVIVGGPMMGFRLPNHAVGTEKSTNCLIFPDQQELAQPTQSLPCIRCGVCAEACPASLLPQQLYWFARSENFSQAQEYNLFDCIECGACAYVCPSEIPLVHYYRFAKSEIKHQDAEKARAAEARKRHEFRELRLAREKAERAERHRKAAEARKQAAQQQGVTDEKKATIADAVARAKARKREQESK